MVLAPSKVSVTFFTTVIHPGDLPDIPHRRDRVHVVALDAEGLALILGDDEQVASLVVQC